MNLVSNAVKFTDHGTVSVRVSKVKEIKNGVKLKFSVEDTGIGISSEHLTKIFQSFEQADTSISRRYGGTGLGLVICKRLVEMMGGSITVESKLGIGSTFFFTIDFEVSHIYETQLVDDSFVTAKEPKVSKGYNLLVVEDNDINRLLINDLLEKKGFKVTLASNGQEALDKIAGNTEPFDLVLMDLQMPVMDGFEASKLIRGKLEAQTLPIIALTAAAFKGIHDRIMESGIDDYVLKPVEPIKLYSILEKYLGTDVEKYANETNKSGHDFSKLNLNELKGIDVQLGLMRFEGNMVLYLKVLKMFSERHCDLINDLRKMIATKNYETLNRRIHTFKGLAGNIGATSLQAAAVKLEKVTSGSDKTLIEAELDLLRNELTPVLQSIDSYTLKEDEKQGEEHLHNDHMVDEKEFDIQSYLKTLHQLRPYVDEHNYSTCKRILEDVLDTEQSSEIRKNALLIRQKLDMFAFDEISEIVNNFISSVSRDN